MSGISQVNVAKASPGLGLRVAVLMAAPLSGAGIDIFIPSLPAMSSALHIGPSAVALTIPVYLLAYGLAQPLFGSVSDAYGRRFPLLAGVLLFLLGSLLAAGAPTLEVLMLARVLQGIGVSGPAVLTKAVLTDAFEGEERMRMANTLTCAWAVGPVLSPALGGYLQSLFGWRSPFAFLAFYSGLLMIVSLLFWKETVPQRVPFRPAAIRASWTRILSHLPFVLLVVMMAALYSFMTVFNVVGPFLVQEQLGYTPREFGNIALWLGLCWFLGNVANQFLSRRARREQIIAAGLYLNLVLTLGMVALTMSRPLGIETILIPTLGIFLVGGAVFPNLWGRALSLFPESAATAGALMGTLMISGAGLASAGGSFLPTNSAGPLSWCYLILAVVCLLLRRALSQREAPLPGA